MEFLTLSPGYGWECHNCGYFEAIDEDDDDDYEDEDDYER